MQGFADMDNRSKRIILAWFAACKTHSNPHTHNPMVPRSPKGEATQQLHFKPVTLPRDMGHQHVMPFDHGI